jgi:hypothetical protein
MIPTKKPEEPIFEAFRRRLALCERHKDIYVFIAYAQIRAFSCVACR